MEDQYRAPLNQHGAIMATPSKTKPAPRDYIRPLEREFLDLHSLLTKAERRSLTNVMITRLFSSLAAVSLATPPDEHEQYLAETLLTITRKYSVFQSRRRANVKRAAKSLAKLKAKHAPNTH